MPPAKRSKPESVHELITIPDVVLIQVVGLVGWDTLWVLRRVSKRTSQLAAKEIHEKLGAVNFKGLGYRQHRANAQRLIVMSPETKRFFLRHYPSKPQLLYNSIRDKNDTIFNCLVTPEFFKWFDTKIYGHVISECIDEGKPQYLETVLSVDRVVARDHILDMDDYVIDRYLWNICNRETRRPDPVRARRLCDCLQLLVDLMSVTCRALILLKISINALNRITSQ